MPRGGSVPFDGLMVARLNSREDDGRPHADSHRLVRCLLIHTRPERAGTELASLTHTAGRAPGELHRRAGAQDSSRISPSGGRLPFARTGLPDSRQIPNGARLARPFGSWNRGSLAALCGTLSRDWGGWSRHPRPNH